MIAIVLSLALGVAQRFGIVRGYKWVWLRHFLGRSGRPLRVPAALAADWDCNLVRPVGQDEDGNSRYFIRPFGSELFWLVGGMTVTVYPDGHVMGVDRYDFHMQTGQQTVHGNDKSLQWAWSGTARDETQISAVGILGLLARVGVVLYPDCIRVRDGRVEISNKFWNRVGGRPFDTILETTVVGWAC